MSGATPAASSLPPRLRLALWRVQSYSEALELALAEAQSEAALPGSSGDCETRDELERAQFALFHMGNYILRHLGRWGGAA
ncbi:hypothetical protein [Stigmatella hybrida]|uniref:hypothetical protein n=1 Tax=Stigmatella hybrida TaxID=394097 RepID=UPI001CDA58AB|nr:hypothetical protein [Stigmatella hybrida]